MGDKKGFSDAVGVLVLMSRASVAVIRRGGAATTTAEAMKGSAKGSESMVEISERRGAVAVTRSVSFGRIMENVGERVRMAGCGVETGALLEEVGGAEKSRVEGRKDAEPSRLKSVYLRVRRRRRTNNVVTKRIMRMARPPRTPPAIVPALDLWTENQDQRDTRYEEARAPAILRGGSPNRGCG